MFTNLENFLAGRSSRFTGVLPGADIERSRRNTLFGFYVQDDLTLHARLTLNLGLRYEFDTVPNETSGRDSSLRNPVTDVDFTVGPIFENPSLKNLGPRVGFAWDVLAMARRRFKVAPAYYDTDGTFNTALLGATFRRPSRFLSTSSTPRSLIPRLTGCRPSGPRASIITSASHAC